MAGLPVDRIVFASPSVHIGAFRCPVHHPDFRDSGPIRNHCFVFPRTSVVIQHRDERPFSADPNVVTLYNKGQLYRRQPISPDGDRCDYYAVSPRILREAVSEYDPRAADDDTRPIQFARVTVDAETYFLQRRLFKAVTQIGTADRDLRRTTDDCRRCGARDLLFIEETVCELLDRVLARAYAAQCRRSGEPRARRAADDLADAAGEVLGRRFAEPLSLADIAEAVDTSVFHLCRSFRRSTGATLHEYRHQLRLRSALDRLERTDTDLSQLALDLGYSSHSHFTAAFRRAFGVTPSTARRHLTSASS